MYALRRSRSGVLVAWARRMHPMHGQRTAPRQESRKWTADPGRTLHDSRADRQNHRHDTHRPFRSKHSPPRGGCRGAGGACERGRSALCAAWMRAQRVLPRRAACAVLRWSRGAWSARARVRSTGTTSTDARREMGVCDGGRRRLKYGSGRACAATVVRSDARGPAPQLRRPDAFLRGPRNFVRIDYREWW